MADAWQATRLLLVLLSLITSSLAMQEGKCVMYGQCGEGDYGSLNCVYNGPPKEIVEPDAIAILKQMCPEYVDGEKALTCCDLQQIETMEANFKLPQRLIGRCPSCFANFRRNFCRLSCSPTQSDYLKVTGTEKGDDGKELVSELVYFMSESFAGGMFNSCREVEGIIPGTRVIDMMCGKWGPKCNGHRWLAFMGSTPDNQGFSPFQINYTITTEEEIKEYDQIFHPMKDFSHRCDASPKEGEKVCECGDCPAACYKPLTTSTPSTTLAPSSTTSSSPTTTTTTTTPKQSTEASSTYNYSENTGDVLESAASGGAGHDETSGASESRPRFLDSKLFRRILSPLIVIAPAFADN